MNSPVTFYYFESTNGNEFYICDFLYYYNGTLERYNNYKKPEKEKFKDPNLLDYLGID